MTVTRCISAAKSENSEIFPIDGIDPQMANVTTKSWSGEVDVVIYTFMDSPAAHAFPSNNFRGGVSNRDIHFLNY